MRLGTHPSRDSAQTLADRELLAAITECEAYVARWQNAGGDLAELVILLKNQLTCIFHEITDEAAVYSVFEVLNSRGLDVSWFDRLKSMLMAIVFDTGGGNRSEILNEVHQLWTDIYACIGLRIGMSAESLQFAATLRLERCPNRPLGQADAAELLRDQSKSGPSAVIETTRWLKAVTEAVNQLHADRRRNAVTSIAQARLVATAILLREDLPLSERERLMRRWENVSFRIYGLYDKDARTGVGDYVRLAWRIVQERLPVEQILSLLAQLGQEYPVDKAVALLSKSDRYTNWQEELRYFFYRYEEHLASLTHQVFKNEQWNRIWEANAADSIDHILAQSRASEKIVHRLGNLLVLPPGLNSRLGASAPKNKAADYQKTDMLIAQEVASQLLHWSTRTIQERDEHLMEWAAQEWADKPRAYVQR